MSFAVAACEIGLRLHLHLQLQLQLQCHAHIYMRMCVYSRGYGRAGVGVVGCACYCYVHVYVECSLLLPSSVCMISRVENNVLAPSRDLSQRQIDTYMHAYIHTDRYIKIDPYIHRDIYRSISVKLICA